MFNISLNDHPSKIREIDDEDLLIEIALRSTNPAHRMVAIERITNQDILDLIVQQDHYFVCQKVALHKLSHESLVSKYITSDDSRLREIAIRKLRSQEKIEYILLNEPETKNRVNVLKYYWKNEPALLTHLILRDLDPKIRREALVRMEDQDIILRVALSDDEEEVRELAKSKLSAPQLQNMKIIQSKGLI